jgi:tRNA(adenine34) deaminase
MKNASSLSVKNPTDSIWDLAFAEAKQAAARGETPVGAVIVQDGSVLASAGNRVIELRDPTAHAEVLAIRMACERIGSERLPSADLYVTLEPCTLCAGAISFARIRRLYFAASDSKGGAVENGVVFFNSSSCHHAPEVYGGFREAESATLLKSFFAAKR